MRGSQLILYLLLGDAATKDLKDDNQQCTSYMFVDEPRERRNTGRGKGRFDLWLL
jgi:hypothetical protein